MQIGLHPEGAFLMRFMPHPTDPEKFTYDTMTLVRPVDDPDYSVPGWMGLPEGTDTSGKIWVVRSLLMPLPGNWVFR